MDTMDNDILKKLQSVETEILVVVDKFCREYNINYSLYAGTALGAVRHGGFIPWDDDIDICMDRVEYERFLSLWREHPVDGYTLAADDEKGCHINHTKIIKDGTILSSKADLDKPIPHGIWLDVFAMDKIPVDKKIRKKLLKFAKLRLVYTRDYPYVGGSKLLYIVSKLMLAKPKKTKIKLKEKYTRAVTKYKNVADGFMYVDLSCPGTLRFGYEKNIFEVKEIKFADFPVFISEYCDEMLTIRYGEYMQLPPEEKRVCSHSPEVIDFGEGNI